MGGALDCFILGLGIALLKHKRMQSGKKGHKKYFFLGSLILLIVILRILAPSFILKRLNAYLRSFSPLYSLHIDDLDLHFYRMAYSFEGVEGVLKKDHFKFLEIPRIDISLAWRELLRFRIVTDVAVLQADLRINTKSLEALSGHGDEVKEDAQNVKDATIPFNLERLGCENSRFEFSDVIGLPPKENLVLSHIELVAHNLTPKDKLDLSKISAEGKIQETAKIKLIGKIGLKRDPKEWHVNIETQDLELTKINPIASRMLSVTFKEGTLAFFSAIKSANGDLQGYVKPFLKDLVFIGDRKDFKGFKHFIFEIIGTIGNFFLKNSKTHALATRVNFHSVKDGSKVDVDTGKALKGAIKNGFGKGLRPSLDETLELK